MRVFQIVLYVAFGAFILLVVTMNVIDLIKRIKERFKK
jgi:hypothetical protein